MTKTKRNVEVLRDWSEEDLSPEDINALTDLTLGLEDDTESRHAWQDPQLKKVITKAGEDAVKAARLTAKDETLDRMNDTWIANPDAHESK
jgi:hypothetical protein